MFIGPLEKSQLPLLVAGWEAGLAYGFRDGTDELEGGSRGLFSARGEAGVEGAKEGLDSPLLPLLS